MPAIRRQPSRNSASRRKSVQHRKPIEVSHPCDFSSQSREEYADLETELDATSRSESDTEFNAESNEDSDASSFGVSADDVETPAPKSITISGISLRPTVAFDTFWRFAAERKAIDDKRRAGEPAP